ncbi:MAG: TetR/AcrR family transcriptional regulator [Spirochaetes bacterium]|nr:TetR/AcrR family transcriptional regulator [Spirochaetota bacterium]
MNAEARKAHILKCAKKLFAEHGYYKTQISDIIREAKIARGTVYQYFENKDDLFVTLLENFYADWEKAVALNLKEIDLDKISAKQYIFYRIKNTLKFLQSDRDLCSIVLRMGVGLHKDFDLLIQRFEAKILNLIASDLELGIRYGNVRTDINIELASNLIAGALFRLSYHYFVYKKGVHIDLDAITTQIVNIIIPGIFVERKKKS